MVGVPCWCFSHWRSATQGTENTFLGALLHRLLAFEAFLAFAIILVALLTFCVTKTFLLLKVKSVGILKLRKEIKTATEKFDAVQDGNNDTSPHREQKEDVNTIERGDFVEDKRRAKRLTRARDVRILPICLWIYLVNHLDRGNIGNSKVLNEGTHDDQL